jgi:hypothetical protein
MAGKDLIRYDLLVQDALKGVVRKVLIDAGKDGLPGEHHFYISFRTDFPGVRLSNRLREKYPQEMTIVLQHQFWDLVVTEHSFEVGLSFSGIPERLLNEEEDEEVSSPPAPQPVRGNGSEPVSLKQSRKPSAPTEKKQNPDKSPSPVAKSDKPKAEEAPSAKPEASEAGAPGSAEVVSLDAFRKKN